MRYPILTLFLLLILISCKNTDVKVIHDDLIILNPNLGEIQKRYYKYSTLNPFNSNEFLYSPIGPSKNEKGKAKVLVSNMGDNVYNFNHFYKYIERKMDGTYESYIFDKNNVLYRDFTKIYNNKENVTIKGLDDIKNYFSKKKIGYKLLKDKRQNVEGSGYVFLLKRDSSKDSAICSIFPSKEKLTIYFYYSIKDTIQFLRGDAMDPYRGENIEN